MRYLFLVATMLAAACSSTAPSSIPSNTASVERSSLANLSGLCHNHRRFMKVGTLESHPNGVTTRPKIRGNFFTTMVVWNHLNVTSVEAYPVGGKGGPNDVTIPPKTRLPAGSGVVALSTPSKGMTVVMLGSHDTGPGVEVNDKSCPQ